MPGRRTLTVVNVGAVVVLAATGAVCTSRGSSSGAWGRAAVSGHGGRKKLRSRWPSVGLLGVVAAPAGALTAGCTTGGGALSAGASRGAPTIQVAVSMRSVESIRVLRGGEFTAAPRPAR